MAKTAVEVLRINTLEAANSVTDLKNNISELKRVINGWTEETEEGGKKVKKSFEGLTIGTEEYQKAVTMLQENQAALRNAMYGTAASLEDVKKAAQGTSAEYREVDKLTGKTTELTNAETLSYNELVRTLAKMKEEWRSTADEQERADLGKKINAVNNRLKEMDASVGVYGRNVGMYANVVDQLGSSFQATAGGAGAMINPIKGATNGLKAMSATPVIAILGLLANIIDKLIKSLKSSEEGMESVTAAMGALSGVGDMITSVLQGAAQAVGWLAKQFVNLLDKLNLVSDKMKAKQEIAQEEIRIAKQQRDATMKNAEAERDIAELRAKAADKEKYSTKERIAFLEEASRKQEEVAKREKKAAEDEYKLIVKKNAQTKSSAEDLKAEADAYARMVQADTNYQNQVRANLKEITAARKEAAREAKERQKEAMDAEKAKIEAEKGILEQEISLMENGSQDKLAKQKEVRQLEYELAVASAKDKIKVKEDLDRQLLLLEQIYHNDLDKMDREFENEQVAQAIKAQENKVAALTKGTAQQMQETINLRQMQVDTLAKMDGESEAEYEARAIAAYNALKEARLEYATWEEEQTALEWENRMFTLEDGSMQALANQVALKEHELETIHQLEGESNAEFRQRELAAEKAFYDAKKKQRDAWISTMTSAAGAVSGILGSIADMYESNTEMTEEEAKKAKNLRIASATIDMLQGAVTAYAGAQSLGVPMGPIIGAINAAAVVAAGIANIAKIRATDVSAKSSGGGSTPTIPAAVSAPTIEPQVQETRTITSASEEDRLNRMADEHRVYILSSDLEADREQTRTRIAETTF